jgi:hypothetical protein
MPFVFKDKIVEALKNAVNDAVIAEVSFGDADISFIRSFPDLSLKITDVNISGKDTFEDVTLMKAGKLSFDVDIMSLLSKSDVPPIEYFGIENGFINILVLPDGTANYQIMPEDTTVKAEKPTKFSLDIKKYEILNSSFIYTDQSMPVFVSMKNLNHTGSGNFSSAAFDLKTTTGVDSLTVRYDGDLFFTDAKAALDAVIAVDMDKQKFVLKDNKLQINELNLAADGYVQLFEEDMDIQFSASTPFEDIRQLLSVIPHAYTGDFASVKTSGKASFDLKVNGRYNGSRPTYPAFECGVKVENGYILYPGSPFPVENLFVDLTTGAKKADMSDLYVKIPSFRFSVNKDQVNGLLNVDNAMGNQAFTGKIAGKLNMGHLQKALPLPYFETLEGLLDANMQFSALMSHIQEEKYEKIEAKGHFAAQNLSVKMAGNPLVKASMIKGDFSPRVLDVAFTNLMVASSHIDAGINVLNPLAFFTMDKASQAKIVFKADKINMDEWNTQKGGGGAENQPEFAFDKKQETFIKESTVSMDGKIGELRSGHHTLNNVVFSGDASANLLKVNRLSATIGKSDLNVSGVVKQAYDYIFGKGILLGQVSVTSDYFDSNMFAGSADPEVQTTSTGPFIIPERMDIEVDGKFNTLKYTEHVFNNLNGKIHLKNQQVVFEDIRADAFGGNLDFTGSYATTDPGNPEYAMKLNIGKVKFTEAFRQIEMFKKLVPLAEFIQGFFNTSLVMKGRLLQDMSPDLTSLDASGFIETLQGRIKAYPPLQEVGNTLKIKELHDLDLTNTKNWFDIVKGVIDIKPFQKSVKGIDMDISGKHSFKSGMDILMKMKIPRELLEKNKVTATANTGLYLLEKEAAKIGLDLKQGEFINLRVQLTGRWRKPTVKITPLASEGEQTYRQAAEDKLDATGKKLKDTLQKEFEKGKAKVRDTLTKAARQQMEKGKAKVEKEVEKAVEDVKEKAKKEVISKIDTLIADTLKQKAKDVLDKNAEQEINKIKDKLKDFDPFKKKKKN